MKVLIVDDEEDIRQISHFALSKVGGMNVVEAASGAEALAVAVAEMPDAILMDVLMPNMDGLATLAALRQNPATEKIPVIFLTARGLPEEIEKLKKLGAAGVITKPFDPMTLSDEMKVILGAS